MRQHPGIVRGLVLMEPVALLTCWPKLLGTFVYGSLDLSKVSPHACTAVQPSRLHLVLVF